MKKLFIVMIFACLLIGCSEEVRTARDLGKGVSIDIQTNETINHLSLEKYVNGILVSSDNVIHADNSPFEKGEIIYFDTPIAEKDKAVEIVLAFSENLDGTNSRSTEKVKIGSDKAWTEFILNEQLKLEKVQ